MMVLGAEISDDLLEEAWSEACKNGLSFVGLDRQIHMRRTDLTMDQAARAADRLLQRKRKAGACRYHNGKWEVLK